MKGSFFLVVFWRLELHEVILFLVGFWGLELHIKGPVVYYRGSIRERL